MTKKTYVINVEVVVVPSEDPHDGLLRYAMSSLRHAFDGARGGFVLFKATDESNGGLVGFGGSGQEPKPELQEAFLEFFEKVKVSRGEERDT